MRRQDEQRQRGLTREANDRAGGIERSGRDLGSALRAGERVRVMVTNVVELDRGCLCDVVVISGQSAGMTVENVRCDSGVFGRGDRTFMNLLGPEGTRLDAVGGGGGGGGGGEIIEATQLVACGWLVSGS